MAPYTWAPWCDFEMLRNRDEAMKIQRNNTVFLYTLMDELRIYKNTIIIFTYNLRWIGVRNGVSRIPRNSLFQCSELKEFLEQEMRKK